MHMCLRTCVCARARARVTEKRESAGELEVSIKREWARADRQAHCEVN